MPRNNLLSIKGSSASERKSLAVESSTAEPRSTSWQAELPTSNQPPANTTGPAVLSLLERVAFSLEALAVESKRIADQVAPEPGDVVGTPYLAQQLGCSVVWAAEMARNGQIPKSCIVPGTGNGKPWKFYRRRIEEWLIKR